MIASGCGMLHASDGQVTAWLPLRLETHCHILVPAKYLGVLAFETRVSSFSQSRDGRRKGRWDGKVMSESNETRTEGRSLLRYDPCV